jgi:peptidoglycan/LPS O-acetylase OafA/YrhL
MKSHTSDNNAAAGSSPCVQTEPPTLNNPPARHQNNFGFLRLLLAILVILSHSPEILDGNRSREILSRIFGTMSFGELAVDGFFLISGYLITQSLIQSRTLKNYLLKRILRIYPGFIVAFLISMFVVGSIGGGIVFNAPVKSYIHNALNLIFLSYPRVSSIFPGTHIHSVNGSLWSINYEFRCYFIIMFVSIPLLFNRRYLILLISAVFLMAMPFYNQVHVGFPYRLELLVGDPSVSLRLTPIFLAGALFYLFRDRIVYRHAYALLVGLCLAPLMFTRFAELAFTLLGGYLIFWFAFKVPSRLLSRVGDKIDLSYGVYLYAWPIQSILIWKAHLNSPWMIFIISTLLSMICAYFSWTYIENPFLKLKNRAGKKAPPLPAP